MALNITHKGYHALVFGASGITGWAIMNNALLYPSPNTFERIVGLTHRPLSTADSQLPKDPRIELYSGIDLREKAALTEKLQQVREIEKTTHVYFAAYTGHGTDYEELKRANMEILSNAIEAIENLCPGLVFFTLQTGGKAYGIEFVDKISLKVPSKEIDPRIPSPYASSIFYYSQYDYLLSASKSKAWKFCEIRPDVIIGFVPNGNAMNLAQPLALFLSLWKTLHPAPDATVPFPGPALGEISEETSEGATTFKSAWIAKRTDTSQDILARFHLYASVHSSDDAAIHSHAFNIADGIPEVVTWAAVWPGICQFFGLKGAPPDGSLKSPKEWMLEHRREWSRLGECTGKEEAIQKTLNGTGWDFMDVVMGVASGGRSVDRQYDLGACREVGFTDKVDTVAGYHIAFERMRKAGILP